MNRENRRAGWNKKLPPCPLCGLDSGERVEDAAPPFDYIVACTSCGARTRPYHSLNCATKAWDRGDVYRRSAPAGVDRIYGRAGHARTDTLGETM